MKKPKIRNFFLHYLNSYGINKKNMFLFFFNYLKTETRNNSEENYTNVSLDGRCSSIFRKNFYSKFNKKSNFFSNKFRIFLLINYNCRFKCKQFQIFQKWRFFKKSIYLKKKFFVIKFGVNIFPKKLLHPLYNDTCV